MAKSPQPAHEPGADAPTTVISEVRARCGYEAIVKDPLQKLVVPSRLERGCLEYSLPESLADPTLDVIYQVREDEERWRRPAFWMARLAIPGAATELRRAMRRVTSAFAHLL